MYFDVKAPIQFPKCIFNLVTAKKFFKIISPFQKQGNFLTTRISNFVRQKLICIDLNRYDLFFQEVMETGNIKQALSELKQMMNMPMKCYTPSLGLKSSVGSFGVGVDENADPQGGGDKENEGKENTNPPMSPPADGDSIPEGDLPGQICRVLGKSEKLLKIRPLFWQIINLWETLGLMALSYTAWTRPVPGLERN